MRLNQTALALVASLSISSAAGQGIDNFLFKGELKNQKTAEVIPWASIFISGSPLGVASNDKGQFEFLIGKQYLNDFIIIHALGYEKYATPIQQLMSQEFHTILLPEKVSVLKEVVITALHPMDILRKAMERWDDHFPIERYEFDSFYRSTQKENGRYSKLYECALRGLDDGYKTAAKTVVGLEYQQVRNSNDYRDPRTRWLKAFFKPQFNFTTENQSRNRYLLLEHGKATLHDFELDSVMNFGDESVYVVSAHVKKGVTKFVFDCRFYIRANDYAFVQMDFKTNETIKYEKPSGIVGSLKITFNDMHSTFVFKEIDHKMFMYYLNVSASFDWHSKEGEVLHHEENSEAIVQNIHMLKGKTTVTNIFNRHAYGVPNTKYDPEFWKRYEMIRQIPYHQLVVAQLEKDVPLEEQFKKNGIQK